MRTYARLGMLFAAMLALAVLAGRGEPAYAWTDPAALNTNAATDSGGDEWPQVATDGGGNWVAVWQSADTLAGTIGADWDILVARSTDNGATWTYPAPLNTNAASDLGADLSPQVTTDAAGNWVAVWYSNENLGGSIGTDYDILVSRSTGNGAIWTYPAALNTNADPDSGEDYWPQVTTDGGGNWVAVWHSGDDPGSPFGTDYDILVARSTDNGAIWTAPVALNTNAATDSDNDYHPQVTTDGAGHWVSVWHTWGSFGSDWDILVARSTDNGATWTALAPLNTNAASDSGDDILAQVTTDGAGNWVAAWYSNENLGGTIGMDDDILVASSWNNGANWSGPGALNTNAATDVGDDRDPQVTTDPRIGFVAVWKSDDTLDDSVGPDWDILVAHGDFTNGFPWTPPAPLNTNADTDSGDDYLPQVTADGARNWVAVWYSDENLLDPSLGPIGNDFDILYATGGAARPVGGMAEYPALAQRSADKAGSPSDDSAWSTHDYALPAALAAVGALVALTAGAWYARRRWTG